MYDKMDEIEENLSLFAEKAIKDAIENIKKRNLLREGRLNGYNVANWRKDWLWIMDTESEFEYFCTLAGYDPDYIRNETMRLAKARIEDGIQETEEWRLAGGNKHLCPQYP